MLSLACAPERGSFEDGQLAWVGDVAITPAALEDMRSQLTPFAQRDFRETTGKRRLLGASVDFHVLAQSAARDGYDHDPRVEWYALEEIAARELEGELERRVPRSAYASDDAQLRRVMETDRERWLEPERRSVRFRSFANFSEADAALQAIASGARSEADFPDGGETVLMTRDDGEHPFLHPMLFDPALEVGDLLPRPAPAGRYVMVARVAAIEAPHLPDLADPRVRDAVIDEAMAPARAEAKRAYLAELESRFVTADVAP